MNENNVKSLQWHTVQFNRFSIAVDSPLHNQTVKSSFTFSSKNEVCKNEERREEIEGSKGA